MKSNSKTLDRNNTRRAERLSRLGILEEPMGYVDGASLYEYVGSNPVNRVDANGLKAEFKLDAKSEVEVNRFPDAPGANGRVTEEFEFEYEIRPAQAGGKFKCELHLKATLTVLMRIRSTLEGEDRKNVIKHEYAHYNTWVKGFWPQIEKRKWFEGKRFLTPEKAKQAGDKLKAEIMAFYWKAKAHSESFDPYDVRRDKLVTYDERPFNEKLATDDIPLDE